MYLTSKRIKAYAIDLNTIVVAVSKQYYGGHIRQFYIRNGNKVLALTYDKTEEQHDFIYYYCQYPLQIHTIYEVIDQYGLTVVVQYQSLVTLATFDTLFYYADDDLGCLYTADQTTWKVWAPTALRLLLQVQKDTLVAYPMIKNRTGVFTLSLTGDYDGCIYTYLVDHGEGYQETTDPYSYGSISNSKGSVVIDTNKCDIDLKRDCLPVLKKKSDAIIYEVSVKDFTTDPDILCRFPGKYLGMIEKGLKTPKGNVAGIEYLKDLGITHVQLMPIYDFTTVEENHPDLYYNWGYDPIQYNVMEGSYSTDPNDAYDRIIECQIMVAGMHQAGIRVVMDIVFNHMYDVQQSAFETLVPGYYFRKNEDGSLSNGSWCGNDVNTSAKMVRKYLVDMAKRYQQLYGIDGLRFDLMGLIDIKTMQAIHQACVQKDHSFIVYGEGWNMHTALLYHKRCIQENHAQVPEIGFFNDQFRDKLKGLSTDDNLHDKGYFAGNMYNTDITCDCLKNNKRYFQVSQSINYVECHDNATIYDKYRISNSEEEKRIRKKRQKLLTMATILAQGIPFIHAGQEWYRTKYGNNNSYCINDGTNNIAWHYVDVENEDIQDIKTIINLRKEHAGFWYDTNQEVENYIHTESLNHELITYTLTKEGGKYRKMIVYINASRNSYTISLPSAYEVLYNSENMQEIVEILPISMVILGLR